MNFLLYIRRSCFTKHTVSRLKKYQKARVNKTGQNVLSIHHPILD